MTKVISSTIEQNKEEKKEYRWKVAISLFSLFVLCSIANVPFSREIRRLRLEPGEMLSVPISDYAFTIGINAIIGAILIFIGLWVSAKSNLGAPVSGKVFFQIVFF